MQIFPELISRWDRYLGMTAAMTQVPVPTATDSGTCPHGYLDTMPNTSPCIISKCFLMINLLPLP